MYYRIFIVLTESVDHLSTHRDNLNYAVNFQKTLLVIVHLTARTMSLIDIFLFVFFSPIIYEI